MSEILKYIDEDDKCYGATGMAIGILVYDGEDMISAISLDAEPGSMVEFLNEYYFAGNQTLSTKGAWNAILKNFNISMAASIANVMCRSIVLKHKDVPSKVKGHLYDCILSEGRESCSLDDDETKRLFDKNYNYLLRVFTHHGVQEVAHDFALRLKTARRLSHNEIIESLMALSRL